MKTMDEIQAQSSQFSGKIVDALTLWAGANQKILRELAGFSMGVVEEGIQLHGKLQSSTLEALKETHKYWSSGQTTLEEWQKDPYAAYQKNLLDGMQEVQKGFKVLERNAVAITQTAEQLQAKTEKASKGIQQTCSEFVAEAKKLCEPSQT